MRNAGSKGFGPFPVHNPEPAQMKRFVFALTLTLAAGPAADAQVVSGPIREVADPNLDDIARAIETPAGPVIVYNPRLMAQVPREVGRFFREHELVHIEKLHGLRRLSEADSRPGGSEVIKAWEREADCLAAERISGRDARVVARWFESLWLPGDPEHDSGFARARLVRACAGVVEDGGPIPPAVRPDPPRPRHRVPVRDEARPSRYEAPARDEREELPRRRIAVPASELRNRVFDGWIPTSMFYSDGEWQSVVTEPISDEPVPVAWTFYQDDIVGWVTEQRRKNPGYWHITSMDYDPAGGWGVIMERAHLELPPTTLDWGYLQSERITHLHRMLDDDAMLDGLFYEDGAYLGFTRAKPSDLDVRWATTSAPETHMRLMLAGQEEDEYLYAFYEIGPDNMYLMWVESSSPPEQRMIVIDDLQAELDRQRQDGFALRMVRQVGENLWGLFTYSPGF